MHGPRQASRLVAVIAATSLALGGIVVETSAAAAPPPAQPSAAGTAPAAPELPGTAELAQARRTGKPVEVLADTTETTKVMARPDGKLELTATRGPVRTRTSKGWADIDTTLVPGTAGRYSPRVTLTPTTVHADGTSRLVSLGDNRNGIDLDWEGPLPQPVIAGDLVTYPDVRPDVDLVIKITDTGYTKTFVIKTPAAATDLSIKPAALTATPHGTRIKARADGSLDVTDANGAVKFHGTVPAMWDSNTRGGDEASTPLYAGSAAVRPVSVKATNTGATTRIELGVPAEVLAEPATRYPLYLDPSIGSASRTSTWSVSDIPWDYTNVSSPSEPLRVGYCGYSNCGYTTSGGAYYAAYNFRSYFNFNTTALTGKPTTAKVYSTTVSALQISNGSGSASNVSLTKSTGLATNYPGPFYTAMQTVSSGCEAPSACSLSFNNAAVIGYLQNSADKDVTSTYFALSAPAENNSTYWKKFGSAAADTKLTVVYDFPPSTPAAPTVAGGVTCTVTHRYVRDTTPEFTASSTTYAATSVKLTFQVYTNPAGASAVTTGSVTGASATVLKSPGTMAALSPGNYAVRVYAESVSGETAATPDQKSGYSAWTYFTIDNMGPSATQQKITSASYPENYWGAAANNSGTFQINTAPDAAGITYNIDTGVMPSLTDGICNYNSTSATNGMRPVTNGVATFSPTGLSKGIHTLSIRSFDHAHNVATAIKTYTFYVSETFAGNSGANLVEAETSNPVSDQPGTFVYTESYGGASGGNSRLIANAPGQSFTYPITAPITAYYALGVLLQTNGHYAKVKFRLDGTDIVDSTGAPITADTYASSVGTLYKQLGGSKLTAGAHRLTVVTISTSAPNCWTYNGTYGDGQTATLNNYCDNGYTTVVDAFTLAPIRQHTVTSLPAAFNNQGISADGLYPADLEMTGAKRSLSKQALAPAGFVQGQPIQIQQSAAFSGSITMNIPLPTEAGDNVVASGQTISMANSDGTYSMPPGVWDEDVPHVGYVNMLVASSCKPIVEGPDQTAGGVSIYLTTADNVTVKIDAQDVITQEYPTPAVPKWDAVPEHSNFPGMLMTHYINSGTAREETRGWLYLLKFPISKDNAERYVKEVTLPSVGTDFLPTCNTPALHVFAMNMTPN